MKDKLPASRTVLVCATARDIGPLPDGSCDGYRIDYPEGVARLTYTVDALDANTLGGLVHSLAAKRPGEITDPMATGERS